MTQTVQMPDGSVHEFPDEATPQMIASALGVSHDGDAPAAPAKPSDVANSDPGIFARLGADWQNRVNNVQAQSDRYDAGQQNAAHTAFQTLGQGAGAVNDLVTEAAKSALPYALDASPQVFLGKTIYNNLPDSAKDGLKNDLMAAVNSDPARKAISLAGQASQAVGNFQQNHPIASSDIAALTNISGLLSLGKSVATAGPVAIASGAATLPIVQKAGQTVLDGLADTAASDYARSAPSGIVKAASALDHKENVTDPLFAQARASGATISADHTDDVLSGIQSQLQRNPKIAPDAADNMLSSMLEGGSSNAKWSGDSTDLDTLMAAHADLNDKIGAAYRAGNNNLARKYRIIQDGLSDGLDAAAADPTKLDGGVDGINAFRAANHAYGQQADLQTLENMVNTANGMQQPANNLAKQMATILTKKGRTFLTDPDERALAEDIASSSTKDELMKTGASRLINHTAGIVGAGVGSIGGPIGSVAGAATGEVLGTLGSAAMRDAAMGSKMKKVEQLRKLILARQGPVPIEGVPSLGEATVGDIAAMPPSQAQKYLDGIARQRSGATN